jgi:hypothetical protein
VRTPESLQVTLVLSAEGGRGAYPMTIIFFAIYPSKDREEVSCSVLSVQVNRGGGQEKKTNENFQKIFASI